MMDSILRDLTEGRSFERRENASRDLASEIRVEPPREVGRGYENAFVVAQGCVVTAKQIQANRTFSENERGFGRLLFVFHLSGQRTIETSDSGRHQFADPSFTICYSPPGAVRRSTWVGGSQETAVVIGFWPDDPPSVIGDAMRQEGSLNAISPAQSREPVWLEHKLSFEMEQAARLILLPGVRPSLAGHLRAMKANELLCLGADAMLSALEHGSSKPNTLQRKVDQVHKILQQETHRPPSIPELAKTVALTASTMADEFQARYGVTISAFRAQHKMKKARHLLVTTNLPLKKIGYEVGYEHASNFCIAFKKHFGLTPTQLRRGA